MRKDVEQMSPAFRATTLTLRRWIRALQTLKPRVSAPERLARACLMVPILGTLLVLFRVRGVRWGRPAFIGETVTGQRFNCHPPDLVQLYVWLFGIWEPDLTALIQSELRPGDTFVDVGANIGVFSLLASKQVGSNGGVVAIEASPVVFKALVESMELNGQPPNVRLVNVGASDSQRLMTIYAGPEDNTGLTTTVASRGFAQEATIEARPLGEILTEDETRRARLVKIDVEGGEPEVIAGMSDFATHCRGDAEVLIELSPHWWPKGSPPPSVVLDPLRRAGFHTYEIENNYWPWRYLWPRATSRPRRVRWDLDSRIARVDLVMSRRDEDEL